MSETSSRWVLRKHGLRPKKSFGQNFLDDPKLCEKIARLALPQPASVLEIGAGLGALTAALAARALRLVAVERDRDLVPILRERFEGQGKVDIIEADAVRLDWLEALADSPKPYVIAGNLPYQLTGRILQATTQRASEITRAVYMVQREVADRLTASPGTSSYGALTVFTSAAFQIRCAFTVAAGAFVPAPKVGSAVIVLEALEQVRAHESVTFRALVKNGFAARRKTLRNAWRGVGGLDVAELEALSQSQGIDLQRRAETLRVEEFAAVAKAIDEAARPSRPRS